MREQIKLMEKLNEMVNSVDIKIDILTQNQIDGIRGKIADILAILERRKVDRRK